MRCVGAGSNWRFDLPYLDQTERLQQAHRFFFPLSSFTALSVSKALVPLT